MEDLIEPKPSLLQNKSTKLLLVILGVFAVTAVIFYVLGSSQFQATNDNAAEQAKIATGLVSYDTDTVLISDSNMNATALNALATKNGLTKKTTNNDQYLAKIGVSAFTLDTQDTTAQERAAVMTAELQKAHPNARNDTYSVEVDAKVSPLLTPNDPWYPYGWHLTRIGAPTAWDTTTGSDSLVIGIADTGTDCTHADLSVHCVPGWNFYDNNSDTTDVYGHGTTTAGTVAALTNNSLGVSSLTWKAKVMPLRISGPDGYANFSTIASAVTYAADHGVKIVNNSYQACGSSTIKNAANYLRSKGGLMTASEGNYSSNTGFAATADIICVSATNSNADNPLTSFSSWGNDVDFAAPGQGIWTTIRGGGYSTASGTSYSAPVVAGSLALIYSTNPSQFTANLAGSQLAESYLRDGAVDLGTAGWDDHYGWGLINVARSVSLANGGSSGSGDTQAPTAPSNLTATATSGTQINLSWTASTDNIGVAGYTIYRDGVAIQNVTSTSYSNTGLSPNTTYAYTVKAYDATNNISIASNTASATTLDTLSWITLPYVSVKTTTTATITLVANKPVTAHIEYWTGKNGTHTSQEVTVAATTQNIQLSGLSAATNYNYFVKITDAANPANILTSATTNFRTLRR